MKTQPILLVVDDDDAVLSAIEDLLQAKALFQILRAKTYSMARKFLAAEMIDVIVADIVLDGEDTGIDLCGLAFALHPRIAMVLISAEPTCGFGSYPQQAVYLQKPFGGADLLKAITQGRSRVPETPVA